MVSVFIMSVAGDGEVLLVDFFLEGGRMVTCNSSSTSFAVAVVVGILL